MKNPPHSNVITKYVLIITCEISIKEEIQKNIPENSVIVPATNSDSASANSNIFIKFCKYMHIMINNITKIGKISILYSIALNTFIITKLNNAIKFKLVMYKNIMIKQNSLIIENSIVRIVAKYIKHVFRIKQPTKNVLTTASMLCILKRIK